MLFDPFVLSRQYRLGRAPVQRLAALFIIAFFVMASNPVFAAQKTILAFGDSLTAGYGLKTQETFPAQLEKKLKEKGHDVRVINAGVTGDTTSGGLTRLEWVLQQKPDYVIVALGANDMLRGTDPKVTRENMKGMLEILKKKNLPVLLAGMKSFRNLGAIFGDSYQRLFKELASEYDTVFYPFFLEGIALDAGLNQDDGLHPNAAGVAVIVDNILPYVEDLLEKETGE